MITLTNFQNLRRYKPDEVWAIVRSLKYKPSNVEQVTELSPSPSLFRTYLGLKNRGAWNENTFNAVYRPAFMAQIKNDPAAQKKLNELIKKHKAGKHIVLVCFCSDARLCHRSLISEMLTERGVKNTLS